MANTEPEAFHRYLQAKTTVDDRALNPRVWARLLEIVAALQRDSPVRILELGAGIGTMVNRLLAAGALQQADYMLLDQDKQCLEVARRRLAGRADGGASAVPAVGPRGLAPLTLGGLRLTFTAGDAAMALGRMATQGGHWDAIIAHAFLDLVDLDRTLPAIRGALRPGGLLYATINFDGLTLFEPQLDPDFEARLLAAYHRTMDDRRVAGKSSGHSQTGRRLFAGLRSHGGQILEAGSSDWVVWPKSGGYPADEAFFLHFLVETIQSAVRQSPDLPAADLAGWTRERHAQIERCELFFVAHQLDYLCRFEGDLGLLAGPDAPGR